MRSGWLCFCGDEHLYGTRHRAAALNDENDGTFSRYAWSLHNVQDGVHPAAQNRVNFPMQVRAMSRYDLKGILGSDYAV